MSDTFDFKTVKAETEILLLPAVQQAGPERPADHKHDVWIDILSMGVTVPTPDYDLV
ncbi:hypothetical protein [Pseudooceanicola sp.]|uniref:hypothetical protein n=1 Tax=Pseudooceanicola sp. TaxID=1914328 RepID=UPI0035C69375